MDYYHPQLREHILRHKKGQLKFSSPYVQNKFLDMIAAKIRRQILVYFPANTNLLLRLMGGGFRKTCTSFIKTEKHQMVDKDKSCNYDR